MIQSIIPLLYDARNGQKSAIIEIEITNWSVTTDGITYNVIDHSVNGNVKVFISSKEVFRSWDQLNSLNDYLESTHNYLGMSKKEIEFTKVKHALLLETQTNPVYGSIASNWVLIENAV